MSPSSSLLRAFRHPFILLSIALLVLNDHLLKTFTPSWATGKISDFAGLFFFPFLIGVLFQAIRPKRIPSRRALLVGFLLTATVFAGIKTVPEVNAWAIHLLSSLYRQPVQITLDPTDCLALVVFIPAWALWLGIERYKETPNLGKIPYVALAVGSLAALATSPCAPTAQVTRLAVDSGTIYAGIGITNRIEDGGYILASLNGWEDWHMVMYSEGPGEVVWRTVAPYEAIARNPFLEPRHLPFTLCDPAEPRHCYRIDGRAQVDESLNDGQSWETVWQAISTREDFRRRLANGVFISCYKVPDLQTFDLVLIPGESGTTLIVALGNEGLLIHPPSGGWQAVGIATSPNDVRGIRAIIPTPFAVHTIVDAINVSLREFLFALSAGLLAWFILSIYVRGTILRRIATFTRKQINGFTLPAKISIGWTLLIPAAMVFFPGIEKLLLSQLGFPFWLVLAILIAWDILDHSRNIPAVLKISDRWAFFWGLWVFITAWLPMGLWAYGVIERYSLAIALSICFGLASQVGGTFQLHRQVREAMAIIINE